MSKRLLPPAFAASLQRAVDPRKAGGAKVTAPESRALVKAALHDISVSTAPDKTRRTLQAAIANAKKRADGKASKTVLDTFQRQAPKVTRRRASALAAKRAAAARAAAARARAEADAARARAAAAAAAAASAASSPTPANNDEAARLAAEQAAAQAAAEQAAAQAAAEQAAALAAQARKSYLNALTREAVTNSLGVGAHFEVESEQTVGGQLVVVARDGDIRARLALKQAAGGLPAVDRVEVLARPALVDPALKARLESVVASRFGVESPNIKALVRLPDENGMETYALSMRQAGQPQFQSVKKLSIAADGQAVLTGWRAPAFEQQRDLGVRLLKSHAFDVAENDGPVQLLETMLRARGVNGSNVLDNGNVTLRELRSDLFFGAARPGKPAGKTTIAVKLANELAEVFDTFAAL